MSIAAQLYGAKTPDGYRMDHRIVAWMASNILTKV